MNHLAVILLRHAVASSISVSIKSETLRLRIPLASSCHTVREFKAFGSEKNGYEVSGSAAPEEMFTMQALAHLLRAFC